MSISKPFYDMSVAPSMACAKRCGNLYTGSLYGGLASLLSCVSPEQLIGKRVLMFAFGGGCAASLYALRVSKSPENIVKKMNLLQRLGSMKVTSVDEYLSAMQGGYFHPIYHNTELANYCPVCRFASGTTANRTIPLKVPSTICSMVLITWNE